MINTIHDEIMTSFLSVLSTGKKIQQGAADVQTSSKKSERNGSNQCGGGQQWLKLKKLKQAFQSSACFYEVPHPPWCGKYARNLFF